MATATTTQLTTQISVQYPDPEGPLHPLYMQYPRQAGPQPAYLELDPTGDQATLSCGWSSQIGHGEPVSVWEGWVLRWGIPADLSRTEITALLDEVTPLAEIVADGATSTTGHDGRYTPAWSDAAQDATARIDSICSELSERDPDTQGVWAAADWNFWWQDDLPVVQADATDEQLHAMAAALQAEAEQDGVTLWGTLEVLEHLREAAQEQS